MTLRLAGQFACVLWLVSACSGGADDAPTIAADAPPTEAFAQVQPDATTPALSRLQQAAVGLISARHYLRPSRDKLRQQLEQGATLQSLLKDLDPYSRHLSADEVDFRRQRAASTRTGVGLDVLFEQGGAYAIGIPGTPFAEAFGFDAALPLDALAGKPIDFADIDSYRALTTHAEGETLQVQLAGKPAQELPVVDYANAPLYFGDENGVPVVRVRQFVAGQSGALAGFLRAQAGAASLIVDLRFSPGGDLFAMTDWLSLFLPEGTVIGELDTAGSEGRTLTTLAGRIALPPVTVRISRFTASSAEIFARALKAHLPGTRVTGEATRGKCLVQQTFSLSDGSELVLSTGRFVAGGVSCEGRPLQPD